MINFWQKILPKAGGRSLKRIIGGKIHIWPMDAGSGR
jgi:hypothetical protein